MGNWSIHIEGTGPHDNGIEADADLIAKEVVVKLGAAGHKISVATFATGSSREITEPGKGTLCNPGELLRLYNRPD